ncbi:MAG: hypothetical protein OXR67_08230 [Chloroflexota bacterium]|nr:hypothetical protein [Chloroflexota bacterium]
MPYISGMRAARQQRPARLDTPDAAEFPLVSVLGVFARLARLFAAVNMPPVRGDRAARQQRRARLRSLS